MQANTSTERRELRNTLLAHGYRPLPLADKGVFIQGWSRAEIDQDWLEPFARVARYPNTGLRCDDLIAFDIDVLDEDLADQCEALIERRAGETDFCRIGKWPKRLLVYRLDGEPDRSGRTGKYGGHMCELLATHGRQFAAFGMHPSGKPYEWEHESPLKSNWADLPPIQATLAAAILGELDELLADTGLELERAAHMRDGAGRNEYDLLPETIVQVGGEELAWADLRDQLTTDGVFGNMWREEYQAFGDSDAIHFYLAHGSLQPAAHDFVNDCTHWDSTWRPELGELLPEPPQVDDNLFIPDDMADLIENCVILRDKTVRRLDSPMRVYPLDGFVRSMQHLQVPDPNPPKSNPNKTIPFTKVWEQDPRTHKADYAAMRPDHPDTEIIFEGSERVMNTYMPAEHPAAGGTIGPFLEFIEHLIPSQAERNIFLGWLAHKVENPGHRMHGMVMVTPAYGTGRGTLVQILQRLFGQDYVNEVELADLIGQGGQSAFNAYMADSLIVTVGEALEEREDQSKWSSRHIAYERLKIVCDPIASKMHIRRKYGRNESAMVFASLFISSNHTDALAIEPGDRRLIVLDNTECPLVDAPGQLYERIHIWKDRPENIGALHRKLEHLGCDYDAFGAPPMTPAKERMIEASQSDTDRLFEIFAAESEGDICTPAQWRHFAHDARIRYDLDLPIADKLDAALAAVISKRGRRLEAIGKGQIKVKNRPVRPWIIRNFDHWKGNTDKAAIRAEILKNGDPGGMVAQLPTLK